MGPLWCRLPEEISTIEGGPLGFWDFAVGCQVGQYLIGVRRGDTSGPSEQKRAKDSTSVSQSMLSDPILVSSVDDKQIH